MVSGIIVLVIMFSYIIYDLSSKRVTDAENKIAMEIIANDVVDSLARTNGIPGGWEDNPASATTYGLADSPQVLDLRKVNAFVALNYNTSKNVMGIDNFQYYFALRTILNGTMIKQSGVTPTNSSKIVINPRMTAVYNNTVVYIDFLLWR